jgi:heterodisulfide reductase subunit A
MKRELGSGHDQIQKSPADSIRISLDGHLHGDVMVVGGGISGVQASLDLAASGFKVYLVDKAPAIGGHMAQLDKTFPTNDCSI